MEIMSDEAADEMNRIFASAFDLWQKKHQSYGPHNISTFGERGVVVRMWDKLQRLVRLVWNGVQNPLQQETIDDTYMDILVYAAIALCIRHGKWPSSPFQFEENDNG